jgi:hypothetical protein
MLTVQKRRRLLFYLLPNPVGFKKFLVRLSVLGRFPEMRRQFACVMQLSSQTRFKRRYSSHDTSGASSISGETIQQCAINRGKTAIADNTGGGPKPQPYLPPGPAG